MSDVKAKSPVSVLTGSVTSTSRFEVALRRLADCGRTGGDFFDEMVRALSEATCARVAFIGELVGTQSLRGVAYLIDGRPGPDITYDVAGTPCQTVIQKGSCFQRSGVQAQYPDDKFLSDLKLESYLGTVLRDANGNATGVISILHDQPLDPELRPEFLIELFAGRVGAELERQRAERALRENEERFSLFMRHVPGAAWMKDLQGRYVYVNEEAERIFGKTREQIIGFTDDQIFPRYIAAQFKENDRRAFVEGTRLQTLETLPQADGLHYSVVSKFPISNESREIKLVGGIAIDVTERHIAEQALQQAEQRFRLALRSNALTVYEQDENLRYQWLYPPIPEAIGKTDYELADGEDASRLHKAKSEVLRTGTPVRLEVFVRRAAQQQYFDLIIEPRRDSTGRITGIGGVALDITERKLVELALKRSEARYRALVEASSQAVWAWNPISAAGNFHYVQEWWQKLTGQSPEAQQNDGWFNAIYPDDRDRAKAAWQNLLERGIPFDHEYRVQRHDGQLAYIHSRAVAIEEDDGKVQELVGTLTDVTSRRRAEEDLRTSERIYRGIGETINYGVWVCDPEGRNIYASPSFLKLVGLTQQQCSNAGWTDVLHPDDVEATRAAWLHCVATGDFWERTHRFRGADGKWHYVLARGVPIRDPSGRIQCWAGINLDVDEFKMTEEALRISEERFKIATDAGRVGTWEWDIVSGKVFWSDLIAQLHGMKLSDFGGTLQDFERLIHPDHRDSVAAAIKNALEHGKEYSVEFQGLGPQAQYHWYWTKARVIRDQRGDAVRMIGATMDITEQKRAEASLREQARQLAEIDRRKDGFIAMLAHELRNPLGPIRNGVQLLRKSQLDPSAAERLREMIDRQASHMSRIVDDLLDVSRITNGRIVLKLETIDLVQMVRELAGDYRHDFERAQVTFKLEIQAEAAWVIGDRTRLAQAVGNLLHNAAKFTTAQGQVTVRLAAIGDKVELVVADDGAGIDPAVLPMLFEPFVQGSQALDRSRGGLGLGLALVKGLIDLHGGTVKAFSDGIGKGAEFILCLPLTAAPADPRNSPLAPRPPKARRILVVEDNPDAAESLQMLLTFAGHTVKVAGSGLSALEIAAAWTPDLVICDIGLPQMDGYTVCRKLRELPLMQKTTLIALTGYGQEEDQRRALAAGFNRHLTKPIDPDQLERLVAEIPD
ncbi:MAG TPA: PAS domain S-box protein [Planctomycetota bacterium]|nr:PAS domain S-box protein [Planctomycetota bacterium]